MSSLFDMQAVKQDSPLLKQLKEHDIQTHHAPHCEEPWMAIPMKQARKIADEYDPSEEHDSIPSITASIGSVLEDRGLVITGASKREVEDEALARVHGH